MEPRLRRFSARDGLRLAALDWAGPAGGTPLLCLPGVARTALDFNAVARRHCRTRRVVALDYAGHGESARAADPGRYRTELALRDLLDAMAALHLHRVVVLGTSFGGVLGMALGLLRPGCLVGLALNDTGPRLEPVGLHHVRDLIGRDPAFASLEDAAAFLQGALPPLGITDFRAQADTTYARGEDGRWHPRWDIRVAAAIPADGAAQPTELWPLWHSVAGVPLLLVWGQESAVLSATTVLRMREARPDMELVTLPGIGHAPSLREPAAVAGLERFLERLP